MRTIQLTRLASVWSRALIVLAVLVLAGCAQRSGNPYTTAAEGPSYAPTHYYPPPGPPDDPWGPYIVEAAARFQIPQQWIRAVMQQESGGEEQAVSPVGAMGLMQLMPETYRGLQSQYSLGDDPFDPHNNILAGAAYIRQMYDRYGAPGFLAAYNAGPEDVDAYLAGTSSLPDETVNYLAMVTPNLGNDVAFSGPFADYASSGSGAQPSPTLADFASGCDVNAAYDPDHPCSAESQSGVIGGQPSIVADASAGSCDANAAYDPDDPCTAQGSGAAGACDADTAYDPDSPCVPVQEAAPQVAAGQPATPYPQPDCGADTAFNPACPASVIASVDSAPTPPAQPVASAVSPPPERASGEWGIQVGAFTNANLAASVAQNARDQLSGLIGDAAISVPATTPFGGNTLYRARLTHLSAQTAIQACAALNRRQLPCVVVQPASS
jgi:D-alanyl-D-alanine carboxypeptidase